MSKTGKEIRLKRLIDETGVSIICALDHGMTSPVFLQGLTDIRARTREAIAGGANVFMLGRNMAKLCIPEFAKDTALALMLSASAAICPDFNWITEIGTVDEALRLGGDAVVVYVALSTPRDQEMLNFVARVGAECEMKGMPFIAEAEFPTAYMPQDKLHEKYGTDYLVYSSRICAELGADIVKTNWPGSQKEFEKIVKAVPVPVVIAGGSRVSDQELLKRMQEGVEVGAVGCSVGRNIFEHQSPEAMTRALSRVIREKWSAKRALDELKETLKK
jgi:DhnA family fructose-bisphosphate aldolase class Ia